MLFSLWWNNHDQYDTDRLPRIVYRMPVCFGVYPYTFNIPCGDSVRHSLGSSNGIKSGRCDTPHGYGDITIRTFFNSKNQYSYCTKPHAKGSGITAASELRHAGA
jgi:hypothetical protein